MLTIRSQIIHSKSCCFDEDDPLNWPGMGLAGHEVPQTSWSQFVVKTVYIFIVLELSPFVGVREHIFSIWILKSGLGF